MICNLRYRLLESEAAKKIDDKGAMQEIQKGYTLGKNTSHFKRLLMITKNVRRKWIENDGSRITDIITKFPLLENYDMVNKQTYKLWNPHQLLIVF